MTQFERHEAQRCWRVPLVCQDGTAAPTVQLQAPASLHNRDAWRPTTSSRRSRWSGVEKGRRPRRPWAHLNSFRMALPGDSALGPDSVIDGAVSGEVPGLQPLLRLRPPLALPQSASRQPASGSDSGWREAVPRGWWAL